MKHLKIYSLGLSKWIGVAALMLAAAHPGVGHAEADSALSRNSAPNSVSIPSEARQGIKVKDAAASPECKADVERLCSQVEPGRRRMGNCLEQARLKIGADRCRQTVDQAKQAYDMACPCRQDTQKLCKNVEPGEGRVGQCLSKNQKELGRACLVYRGEMAKKAELQGGRVNELQGLGAAPVWSESLR